MMLLQMLLNVLLLYYVGCLSLEHRDPGAATDLAPDEASQVAQAFVDAGLNGIVLLKVRHVDEDIDSCNMIRTSTYEVRLQLTGEVFEISSERNITHASNCRSKHKLVQAIHQGGITRVQFVRKVADNQLKWEEMSVEQFREEMSTLVQNDFRLVNSKYSYRFVEEEEGAESDAELIELHVRMIHSAKEFVVNIEGQLEMFGPVLPRREAYPAKVLLSLLGGGKFSKMKRLSYI